jgi:hypothetical protein
MKTSHATVGIAIVCLAAALSLAGTPHKYSASPSYTHDPSVPPASEALRDKKDAPQGNVTDMAY